MKLAKYYISETSSNSEVQQAIREAQEQSEFNNTSKKPCFYEFSSR